MGEPAVRPPDSAERPPPRPMPGPLTRHRLAVLALAAGVLLLTDVLRVFLPSLITLFGRAGDTPPERMGLYAALWFVLPFAAVPLTRPRGPRPVVLVSAVLLVADRLALQATDGGALQLYVASAGVSVSLVFLYGCALTTPRRAVPAGMAAGLAASAIVHLLLDQVDLVWRDGPLPWLAAAAVCAAFLWAVRRTSPPGEPVPGDVAPAGLWFVFGPTLVLHGMYLETVGLAEVSRAGERGSSETVVRVVLAVVSQLVLVSFATTPVGNKWVPIAGFPVSAILMIATSSWTPSPLVALTLGGCLAVAGRRPASSPVRSGLALLGGALVFLVAVFVYYAAYDIDLGFPNAVVPVLMAALVTVVAVRAAAGAGPMLLTSPFRPGRPLAFAAVVLVAAGAAAWRPLPDVRATSGNEFTLVAYNIRMGFGLKGTLDLDRIAAWARSERPDVVLLSEVDRGWLLNGGHDGLARIAKGLGMRYRFAPAADPLWGDAILTNLPIRQIASHPLGGHDYPTGAQAQAVVLEVGGTEVGIVGTHLQAPPGQAPEVAAIARDLAAGAGAERAGTGVPGARAPVAGAPTTGTPALGAPRPVLLAGDLNTRPGDPEMRVLAAAGLSDPLTAWGNPPTSPADAPVERIDHVLVSRGLTVVGAHVPRVGFSDHLPVVVRLRVTKV
ncbi:endonuclease/exonuclease/phosphatase family protein [Sphaerisporangium corydalis]|uniref:Endonuclease/exonuclease/phosphatase family protein n=1 Tax=Sphaerisporangium corydalis TaxID=1441875 RepID=A0ABV9E5G9_9ACTN|nr:endonuclease/exonuclease/phosphatase family protein [Sphaerisporangium corydalis]